MTRRELIEMIRDAAQKWMVNDMDAAIAERQDPDWWMDGKVQPWDEIDYLLDCASSDIGQCRSYKLAIMKIERSVGVQRRLGKGEQSQVMTSRGSRTLREGDWVFDKRFDELIDE